MGRLLLIVILALVFASTTLTSGAEMSKTTMRKLCEMEEFQQAMAADEELEPAAVVYEVMTKRLEALESHVEELEKRLESAPTHHDITAVAAAIKLELLEHVDDRMNTLASELEKNIQMILKNLMTNLANLGYEQGFELETAVITTTPKPLIQDCEYLANKDYETGVHALLYNSETVEGYCDIRKEDNSAWLVIQRRVDNGLSFYRGWDDYKTGFGDLMGNFYFGNEKIHEITTSKEYMLRIEITDLFGNTGFAEYSNFTLSPEDDGYRLNYDNYVGGTAGDSLTKSKGHQFSTFDNDKDGSQLYSCSRLHRGAFWYDRCGSANLNGVYLTEGSSTFNWQNIFWYTWKRDLRALSSVKMLLRSQV